MITKRACVSFCRLGVVVAIPAAWALVVGCGTSGPGAQSYSSDQPSGVIGAIQSSVAAAGSDLATSSLSAFTRSSGVSGSSRLTSSDCTTHGDPSGISQSDERYPGVMTYCKVSTNDGSPDTVQGGFALVKSVSCALERASALRFDGVARSVTLTVTAASGCWSSDQITDMGGEGTTFSTTVTGSAPASFNSNYSNGIVISIPSESMTFKIGANASAGSLEFITYEDQGTNKSGMTAGSLNRLTGELRYEARMERINCTTSGSCGWNRHIRLYADLEMSGGEPRELESLSFAISNTQAPPGQSGYAGYLVTASGTLSSGIKARLWTATNGSGGSPTAQSDYTPVANWTEVSNTKCYTESSETATTCGSGLAAFSSNTKFAFTGSHTSTSSYFGSINGLNFSSVNVDLDTQ